MSSFTDLPVGNIVARNYKAAEVFDKYRIDFCCQGKKTLGDACKQKNVDISMLSAELEKVMEEPKGPSMDFQTWSPDLLCDYIEKTHHRYVSEAIPVLSQYLEKVVRVHGQRHPELIEVYWHFREVANELLQHMTKEERILFPYIRDLVSQKMTGSDFSPPPFGTIQNPIRMMEQEHDVAGDHLHQVAGLTRNYSPPDDACTTYRVTFAKLDEFEKDLHRHVHLENNVLFPQAIALENELATS